MFTLFKNGLCFTRCGGSIARSGNTAHLSSLCKRCSPSDQQTPARVLGHLEARRFCCSASVQTQAWSCVGERGEQNKRTVLKHEYAALLRHILNNVPFPESQTTSVWPQGFHRSHDMGSLTILCPFFSLTCCGTTWKNKAGCKWRLKTNSQKLQAWATHTHTNNEAPS